MVGCSWVVVVDCWWFVVSSWLVVVAGAGWSLVDGRWLVATC